MISRRDFVRLGASALAAVSLHSSTLAATKAMVHVTAAYEWVHQSRYGTEIKGTEETLQTAPTTDHGSTLSIFLLNQGKQPLVLEKVFVDGIDTSTQFDTPPYRVIWNRMIPNPLAPSMEGEITISLRTRLTKPAKIELRFRDGSSLVCTILPASAHLRIATVGFAHDLSLCHLYVERVDRNVPFQREIWLNGQPLKNGAWWLHDGFVDNCAIAVITFPKPFKRGEYCTFRIGRDSASCGATIRAFSDIARLGEYGLPNFKTMADNGLNSFQTFGALSKEQLDDAQHHGVKAVIIARETIPQTTIGHPALYAYQPMDEVDVVDYAAAPERPEQFRIGTLAPPMTRWRDKVIADDPITPTMNTLDLTFKPANYFIYGPMLDIVNADCYPIAIGWQVTAIREHMRILKEAAGAHPFLFTYQGHFERYGLGEYVSREKLLAEGPDKFVDKTKSRGFERKPTPAEIRQQMLYAIGCGAHGLFNYISATEGGNWVNIGSVDMPEIWQTIGEQSRSLRLVAHLIEIAHPASWAKVDAANVWISTLFCGENAALVIIVNESAKSTSEGFSITPKANVEVSFADLPWLTAKHVAKIERGKAISIEIKRTKHGLSWQEAELHDCALYLVSR